jgi:hypothetical protein
MSETLTSAQADVCVRHMSQANYRLLFSVFASLFMVGVEVRAADDVSEAASAAWSLAGPLEKDAFAFRAEYWEKDLKPDVGKAVRVQLFKGNDYRFCIAVPSKSGVQITATVLDSSGKPMGSLQTVEQGWGVVLSFKPKRTDVYAVAVRQTEKGTGKTVSCVILTGYQ